MDELVARVKVILRRVGRSPSTQLIRRGDLSLDDDAHTVKRGDTEVVLSPTEYKMLRYLMRNAGLVVSKAQILDHVWHYDFVGRVDGGRDTPLDAAEEARERRPGADPDRAWLRLSLQR